MKKITIFLVAMMMLAMATVAFASGTQGESADVYGKYVSGGKTDVYSVDVVWGGMKFDYHAADEEWDPQSHTWVAATGAAWEVQTGSSNTIEVVNHSSVAVSVVMGTANTMAGISGEFSNGTFTLGVPAQGTNGATRNSSGFMPTGVLSSQYAVDTKIGEITVSID